MQLIKANFEISNLPQFQIIGYDPVDTRHRFKVDYTTMYRCRNDVVFLQGTYSFW